MTDQDRKRIEWAAEHLDRLHTHDEVPPDGYSVPDVYAALQRAGANLPPADTEITDDALHQLAAIARTVITPRT